MDIKEGKTNNSISNSHINQYNQKHHNQQTNKYEEPDVRPITYLSKFRIFQYFASKLNKIKNINPNTASTINSASTLNTASKASSHIQHSNKLVSSLKSLKTLKPSFSVLNNLKFINKLKKLSNIKALKSSIKEYSVIKNINKIKNVESVGKFSKLSKISEFKFFNNLTKSEYLNKLSILKKSKKALSTTHEINHSIHHVSNIKLHSILNFVALSYMIIDSAYKASLYSEEGLGKMFIVFGDSGVFHFFASNLIPGFAITKILEFSNYCLSHVFDAIKTSGRFEKMSFMGKINHGNIHLFSALIALCSIPIIIEPIDEFTEIALDKTIRRYYDLSKSRHHHV